MMARAYSRLVRLFLRRVGVSHWRIPRASGAASGDDDLDCTRDYRGVCVQRLCRAYGRNRDAVLGTFHARRDYASRALGGNEGGLWRTGSATRIIKIAS